ncbi:MAG: saccharopine dehydrogenase NADP-binding domain-containing protein [Congregibacter sp.]
MTSDGSRDLDIVIYGATGFTGKLVAEHIRDEVGRGISLRWGLAGRNLNKLQKVRDELLLPGSVALLVADSDDSQALVKIASRAKLIISTVGPFQIHGAKVLAACASQGTDYLDLCGEFNFIQSQIVAQSENAVASGARIVCSAGFDSTPFDAGVFFLQKKAEERFGETFERVKCRVRHADIPVSGGTIASFKAFLAAVESQPDIGSDFDNAFALTPGFRGVGQPDASLPAYEEYWQSWAAPFWMAMINTKNVHRTNFLLGHPYGRDFQYDEMVLTGPGEAGKHAAELIAEDTSILEDETPPGEGPSRAEREAGSYDILFLGEGPDDDSLCVSVKGDMDAGYGSTAKIIAESALLLIEQPKLSPGGIWTPMACMGMPLIERLEAKAGLSFSIEEKN